MPTEMSGWVSFGDNSQEAARSSLEVTSGMVCSWVNGTYYLRISTQKYPRVPIDTSE